MTNNEAIKTIKLAILEVEWEYPMDYAVAFEKAIKALDERKVGKWVKNEHTFWTCSECGLVNKYNRERYAYCPNCGAKMDKE